jgi:hypothetical protein
MKDKVLLNNVIPTRVGTIAVVVSGLFIAAVLVVAPRYAEAKPEYAAKEGKPCGYCHKNPAGGGDRNAKGKQYEDNGHTFKK